MKYYAMLDPNSPVPPELQGFFDKYPGVRKKLGFRPMMQWHFWANRPKPFLPSFVFILTFALVLTTLFPKWMSAAQSYTRQHFWLSLFGGCAICTVSLWLIKISVGTLFGWPLGTFLAGLLQLGVMAGLSAITLLIGQTFGHYVKIESWPVIGANSGRIRFAQLVLGAVFFALLLQLPGVGHLPKIGTRLVALLAVLGLGAIFKSRPGQSEV